MMNGKAQKMSWVQDDVPPGMMPWRSQCAPPHSIGIEVREGRYVFGFEVPSKETPNRLYHLALDPVTREIFHECTATYNRYCSRAGMSAYGPHTVDRPFSKLCRHGKTVKRWAARNRVALEATVAILIERYAHEQSAEGIERRRAS